MTTILDNDLWSFLKNDKKEKKQLYLACSQKYQFKQRKKTKLLRAK